MSARSLVAICYSLHHGYHHYRSTIPHVQIALLKALALVASELPAVPDTTLQQCMSIAERLAGAYPALWPKQRSTIDAAFLGTLKALSAKQAIFISICLLVLSVTP